MEHEKRKATGTAALLWAMLALVFSLLSGGMGTAQIESLSDFLRVCIVLPVLEELVFRGGMQFCLRPIGANVAICLQALLFAALHGSLKAKCYALGMGLIFGWAAEKTGNLWTGLFLHLLNNGLVVAGSLAERGIG